MKSRHCASRCVRVSSRRAQSSSSPDAHSQAAPKLSPAADGSREVAGAAGAAEAAGAAGAAVQEGQESNPSMNKRRQEFISRDSIITRTGAEREIVF